MCRRLRHRSGGRSRRRHTGCPGRRRGSQCSLRDRARCPSVTSPPPAAPRPDRIGPSTLEMVATARPVQPLIPDRGHRAALWISGSSQGGYNRAPSGVAPPFRAENEARSERIRRPEHPTLEPIRLPYAKRSENLPADEARWRSRSSRARLRRSRPRRRRALRPTQGHAGENRRRPPQRPHRRTSTRELQAAVELKAGCLSRTACAGPPPGGRRRSCLLKVRETDRLCACERRRGLRARCRAGAGSATCGPTASRRCRALRAAA